MKHEAMRLKLKIIKKKAVFSRSIYVTANCDQCSLLQPPFCNIGFVFPPVRSVVNFSFEKMAKDTKGVLVLVLCTADVL